MVKALVLGGYGINCEREMALAARLAGATVETHHLQDLLTRNLPLSSYQLILFPGGFSFGDELGAGKALSNRLRFSRKGDEESLRDHLQEFVNRGGCILGVCNGFQILVKMGLLPSPKLQHQVALARNENNRFEDRWVYQRVEQSPCVFTKGMEKIFLPIRHGEGRFVCDSPAVLDSLEQDHQVVFRYANPHGGASLDYPYNPNGSQHSVAGLCDPTGRILGMMAHPEAFLFFTNHPRWQKLKQQYKRRNRPLPETGDGLQLFKNVIKYLQES